MSWELSCGGISVYWPAPVGKRLQGWYRSEREAQAALDRCQAQLDRGDPPPYVSAPWGA